MIVGIGTDICEVERIERAIGRFGDRFLRRVYTEEEIGYCRSKANVAERFAARFAAKEATMKALGTGQNHGVTWKSIAVHNVRGGRPVLRLTGAAERFAAQLGATNIVLSLTHTSTTALAVVVFER
jgi:holo-[acyl-carrier protein] synthase